MAERDGYPLDQFPDRPFTCRDAARVLLKVRDHVLEQRHRRAGGPEFFNSEVLIFAALAALMEAPER